MVKNIYYGIYLIALTLSGAFIEGSFDTLDSASYAPLIKEEYEENGSRFIRVKTIGTFRIIDGQGDISGYHALRNGLIIGQAVQGDTFSLPGPLDALLDLEKATQDVDNTGEWRKFIRNQRDGIDTTKVTLEEMKKLIGHATRKANPPLKDLDIVICPPTPDLKSEKAVYGKKIEELHQRLEKKDSFTVIILIPLRAASNNDAGKPVDPEGDWVTLVIKSGGLDKKGKRLYFVGDSGAASPSLRNNQVLIDLLKYFEDPRLELKRAPSHLVSDKDKESNSLWIQVTTLGKKNTTSIESSETGKLLTQNEAEFEAEKKEISVSRSFFYGIGTGLALLGGYIWMKHRQMKSQNRESITTTQL